MLQGDLLLQPDYQCRIVHIRGFASKWGFEHLEHELCSKETRACSYSVQEISNSVAIRMLPEKLMEHDVQTSHHVIQIRQYSARVPGVQGVPVPRFKSFYGQIVEFGRLASNF